MKLLYVIPARGGSKGIPDKNIKLLAGSPLLHYSLSFARNFVEDEHICISTDSARIIEVAEKYQYTVPFVRPAHLAQDDSAMQDVLLHALSFYEEKGRSYDGIFLLQPTSPIRSIKHLEQISQQFKEHRQNLDMIASVGVSKLSPYFNLLEDGHDGWLTRMQRRTFESRQMAPPVYFMNGSMYIYNVDSLKNKRVGQFDKIRKFVMDPMYCIDIDSDFDWMICEAIMRKQLSGV